MADEHGWESEQRISPQLSGGHRQADACSPSTPPPHRGGGGRGVGGDLDDPSILCRNRDVAAVVKQRAQQLRANQTPAELQLWHVLRREQLGVRFRRQHAIGNVIIDFYCAELRLGIELDGGIHRVPDVRARDLMKTEFLTGYQITLLRFSNDEVSRNLDGVVARVSETIASLTPYPPAPSPPMGRGRRRR